MVKRNNNLSSTTVNEEIFAGLNFCGFCSILEEHKSFSHESFATYKHPGLAPQKYYQENPYNVNAIKV